jgi:hypothetical protein
VPSGCLHGYKDLAVLFRKPGQRAAAEAALSAQGVMTKRYFFPVHRMDVYQRFVRRALPVTDWLHERLLCIPLYSDLPDARIDAIAQLIRASSNRASAQQEATQMLDAPDPKIGTSPRGVHQIELACWSESCLDERTPPRGPEMTVSAFRSS